MNATQRLIAVIAVALIVVVGGLVGVYMVTHAPAKPAPAPSQTHAIPPIIPTAP